MCRIGYTQMYRRGSVVYGTGANGGYEDYLICPACTGIHRFTPDEVAAACRLFDAGGAGKVCFTWN